MGLHSFGFNDSVSPCCPSTSDRNRCRPIAPDYPISRNRPGDQHAATQTADDSARLFLLNRNREQLVSSVVESVELLFDRVDEVRRGQQSRPREEAFLAGRIMCVKALIRQAIELTADDPKQYVLADLLTTAPEELRHPELSLQLARKAVALKPEDGMCLQSLGRALYRTGDWKGRIESIKKQSDTSSSSFILAMAHWQLGEKTEAMAYFDRSNEWLKEYEQLCAERVKNVMHPSMSMLKRLQAEASALLGVTPPTVEPAPEPAAAAMRPMLPSPWPSATPTRKASPIRPLLAAC